MLTATKPKSRRIGRIERKDDALFLYAPYGTLRIEPRSERIVRVTYTVQEDFSRKERPGVIRREPFGDWTWSEAEEEAVLSLPQLTLRIGKADGAVRYEDPNGRLLFSEAPGVPREFEEFDTYRLADVEQKTRIIETADGKKEMVEEPKKEFTGKSFHIRHRIVLGDEALYGLGQQEKGFGSLRGRRVYVHQGNRKIAVPMFVSTAGYGILTDTYSPLIFEDGDNGTYFYTEADQEQDYYFIAGGPGAGLDDIVRGYRFLTGKASLLPRWAYGYIQSQERYETQEEILDIAEESRERGIGLDAIVLDWMSWRDGEWGQKSYDPMRFPDPKGMIERLHGEHVHFMISLWPTMDLTTENHREFAERKLFLPACSVYDAFRPEARELYFEQLKRTHFAYGTDAWWCDSSEPFTPEWSHKMRMEEGDLYRAYCEEAGLRMPYESCNAYPLYHAMGIWENQRRAMEEGFASLPERRVCNLTRSAYTGQQRYGTVMWSGDTDASWETLRDQIAIGLHFCASGLPWWTMDIGAFFVKQGEFWYWNGRYDDTTESDAYCELYTRWYQFGAFLPMFRAHGTDCRRELWNFKGTYYDALLAANRLRYRLMPYLYSEAGKVWLKDRSLIRFPAFDHPGDRRTWDITDQFLFGESLMVCPVTEPMTEGESVREVYFPAGCDWYDFYTKERYAGGSAVTVRTGLDRIPLYVRGGSLLPLRHPALSTEEQTDEIEWVPFGGPDAAYEFYEDAGDGYGYERGEYTCRIVRNDNK